MKDMMPEEHLICDISQKALLFHEGRVLMTRDHGTVWWEFPGGRLNVGEMPLDGLKREMREEVGLEVEPRGVFATTLRMPPDSITHYVVVYLCVFDATQTIRLQEDEVAEARWITEDDLLTMPIHVEYIEVLKRFFTDRDVWLHGVTGTLGLSPVVE
jgi:8-oxo-dGTP diphosphatase